MSKPDDHYDGFLAEELREQFKLILEALSALKDLPADVKKLKEEFAEIKEWRAVVEAVLKDQSTTLNNHGVRLDNLEAA